MKTEEELENARNWWNNLPSDSIRFDLIDKYNIKILSRTEVLEYNETFNPINHSHLIIDFDKVETIEEYVKRIYPDSKFSFDSQKEKYLKDQGEREAWRSLLLEGAKSDAARNYWFKIFQEEHSKQFKQEKS